MSNHNQTRHSAMSSTCEKKLCKQREAIPPYTIDVDFEGASRAWRRNKVQIGTHLTSNKGVFRYACGVIKLNGQPCRGFPACWQYINKKNRLHRGWGECRDHMKLDSM